MEDVSCQLCWGYCSGGILLASGPVSAEGRLAKLCKTLCFMVVFHAMKERTAAYQQWPLWTTTPSHNTNTHYHVQVHQTSNHAHLFLISYKHHWRVKKNFIHTPLINAQCTFTWIYEAFCSYSWYSHLFFFCFFSTLSLFRIMSWYWYLLIA